MNWPSVATPLGNLNYRYDVQNNQIGQSWNEGNGGGSSNYTYDVDNRLLTVTDTVGFASATGSYAYDPAGCPSLLIFPNWSGTSGAPSSRSLRGWG